LLFLANYCVIFAVALADVPYLDFPELKFNKHESTQMPFRYVGGADGEPIMPEVRLLFSLRSVKQMKMKQLRAHAEASQLTSRRA